MNILGQFNAYFDIQTVALLVIVTYSVYKLQNLRNLPPGPWGLPIIGYLPFLIRGLPFKTIAKLTPTHGGVISIQFGSRTMIFLNDYQSIKEGFASSNACSYRPPREMFDYIIPKTSKHVISAEGERATYHRHFILTTLKEFGMGKNSLEPKILDEVSHLIEAIKSFKAEPTNLSDLLLTSTCDGPRSRLSNG